MANEIIRCFSFKISLGRIAYICHGSQMYTDQNTYRVIWKMSHRITVNSVFIKEPEFL